MPEDWTEDLTPGREPSGLRATATSAGIELAWHRPRVEGFGVDGYQVLRRDAYGPAFTPVMWNTRNSNRSWTDRDVDAVVRYVYTVKAVRFKELSGASNEAEATALSSQPQQGTATPSAPENFSATASGASQIDLLWTLPNGEPTGYEVEWSADGSTGWQTVSPAHGGTDTQYSHTSLTANTAYYYRVRGGERRRSGRMVISCGDHAAGAQQSGHRRTQHRRHGPGG